MKVRLIRYDLFNDAKFTVADWTFIKHNVYPVIFSRSLKRFLYDAKTGSVDFLDRGIFIISLISIKFYTYIYIYNLQKREKIIQR